MRACAELWLAASTGYTLSYDDGAHSTHLAERSEHGSGLQESLLDRRAAGCRHLADALVPAGIRQRREHQRVDRVVWPGGRRRKEVILQLLHVPRGGVPAVRFCLFLRGIVGIAVAHRTEDNKHRGLGLATTAGRQSKRLCDKGSEYRGWR